MFFKEFEVPYFYTRLGFKSTHPNIHTCTTALYTARPLL